MGATGIRLHCLLDTGAQVSTITESFFKKHLARENDLIEIGALLSVSAVNGSAVPFIGYVELEVTALGHTYPNLGFLVVRDPD